MTTKHDKQLHPDHFDKPTDPHPDRLEELTMHSRELGKIGMETFAETDGKTATT